MLRYGPRSYNFSVLIKGKNYIFGTLRSVAYRRVFLRVSRLFFFIKGSLFFEILKPERGSV
jgi:hypothetical protein